MFCKLFPQTPTPLQWISDPLLERYDIQLAFKRDDLTGSALMGNKWRKLKYNLQAANDLGFNVIATFGGAYSNHIYATAVAGSLYGFKTVGFIRGEEHLPPNQVLVSAAALGMEFIYVSRDEYRQILENDPVSFAQGHCGPCYVLPEGGTNSLALKGCAEILSEISDPFDIICCAVATGGTFAGLIQTLPQTIRAQGFAVLKAGDYLKDRVHSLLGDRAQGGGKWSLCTDYHFSGYAKTTRELLYFIALFEQNFSVPLDHVYMGKMLYGIYDLVSRGAYQRGTKIVALHTGGYMPASNEGG